MRHARAVMHVGIANPRWRENLPGIPAACATRNFTYLAIGPLAGRKPRMSPDLSIPKLQRLHCEVWEWMSNFIWHFTRCVITYPCGIKVDPCQWEGPLVLNVPGDWVNTCCWCPRYFNSLAPGGCGNNFESMIFKLIIQNSSWGTHCETQI